MLSSYGQARRFGIGMALLCLTLLPSCSKAVQIVRIGPPEALTMAVDIPDFKGATNGDLLRYAITMRQCADKANIQLQAIREWTAKDGKHGKTD